MSAVPGRASVSIHWVRADMDGEATDLALLSGGERAAWARMLPEVKRQRVTARAALRRLLGERLGLPPAEVSFTCGPFGKPVLANEHGSRLAFSVSHSAGWSVIALGEVTALGVDIERLEPAIESDLLAARVMSHAELEDFLSLPQSLRCNAFYRAWVAKEAVAKASGLGLSRGLAGIEVPAGGPGRDAPGPRTTLFAGDCWSILDLDGPPGFAAALAIPGRAPDDVEHAADTDPSGRRPVDFDLRIDHAAGRELGHSLHAVNSHFPP